MTTTMTDTGSRRGTDRRFLLSGLTREVCQALDDASLGGFHLDDDEAPPESVERSWSRGDASEARDIIEAASVPAAPVKAGRGRRLVLAGSAPASQCGRSWSLSGMDVDRLQTDPSWEGRAVCYQY